MITCKRTTFLLMLFLLLHLGCNKPSEQASVNSSTSPVPKTEPAQEAKKEDAPTKTEEKEQDPKDADDPEYFTVLSKVKIEADKYWDERFIKCGEMRNGADRWFTVKVIEGQRNTYLEVIRLRRFVSVPYRISNAAKYNKAWSAKSAVQGEAWRTCSDGPCGGYTGGIIGLSTLMTPIAVLIAEDQMFEGGMFILKIGVNKGVYSSDDPAKDYYRPKGCEEIRAHPIWTEY